jgi:LmbE family N-acetylglucosaminyl deacetylase
LPRRARARTRSDPDPAEPRLRPTGAPGRLNADRRAADGIEVVGDIRAGLALPDASVDAIAAIHFLQDLPWDAIAPALAEVRRVLRQGGVLRLALPDLDRAIAADGCGDAGYFPVPDANARAIGAKLVTQIVRDGSVRTPSTWDSHASACSTPALAGSCAAPFARRATATRVSSSSTTASARARSWKRGSDQRARRLLRLWSRHRSAMRPPVDDRSADAERRGRGAGILVLISPHLDDAVFSCGEALAAHRGSVVLTVFAGTPTDGAQRTEWDARCGFSSAAEAVAVRRAEDERALARLGARPRWLDFVDSQYGATCALREVACAIGAGIDAFAGATVLVPLGLFHSDHRRVHEACRELLATRARGAVLAYEDALYRALPGLLQERLAELARDGWRATPALALAPPGTHADAKREAVRCYASQLRAFGPGGQRDVHEPERAWHLEPPPREDPSA